MQPTEGPLLKVEIDAGREEVRAEQSGVTRWHSEASMQLLLSDDESILLRGLLADYLPSLRREVARTEQHDLRHLMVQRQDLVERLLEQLRERTA